MLALNLKPAQRPKTLHGGELDHHPHAVLGHDWPFHGRRDGVLLHGTWLVARLWVGGVCSRRNVSCVALPQSANVSASVGTNSSSTKYDTYLASYVLLGFVFVFTLPSWDAWFWLIGFVGGCCVLLF